MALDNIAKKEIMDLLVLSLDGQLSAVDFAKLQSILDGSDEARDYYCKAISVAENLRKRDWASYSGDNQAKNIPLSELLRNKLIEQEHDAESVIPEVFMGEGGQNVVSARVTGGKFFYNKTAILGVLSSIAAALLVAFVLFQFLSVDHVETATLTACMDVSWDGRIFTTGERLAIGDGEMVLAHGYASLVFDSNARVTIESPARFELLAEDRIKLYYGMLYSHVSAEAAGFSVATPECLIVDLGTEFGVKVDLDGATELHVNQGRTMLFSGTGGAKAGSEVLAGNACEVNSTGQVVEIQCNSTMFVRAINADKNFIWHGDLTFDLADLVNGGNGWGGGSVVSGINPVTGEFGNCQSGFRKGKGRYIPVTEVSSPYIDGVFVPAGPFQVVSSQGAEFDECPTTNNMYYSEIVTGSVLKKMYESNSELECPDVNRYSNESDAIIMHPNIGMTFNLDMIREDLPDVNIEGFTASAEFAVQLSNDHHYTSVVPKEGSTMVWVLLDGKVVFSSKMNKPNEPVTIDIKLPNSAKFLTLVATDSRNNNADEMLNDLYQTPGWCVFARPELVLSGK